jgi:4-hydroxybenzoate polyprenyltransferase
MSSSTTSGGKLIARAQGTDRSRGERWWRALATPFRSCLLELRPHQWIKNVLVFVPLAAVHGLSDPARFRLCMAAFGAFCLAASSGYVFNDLMDRNEDRDNPQKLERPIASGQMLIRSAWVLQLALLLAAGVVAASLPRRFVWILGAYYLLTCAYSLVLKRLVVADILALAAGYSLRVAAGAAVAQVRLSAWLIALCGSLFMSLALLKRYAELRARQNLSGGGELRGYLAGDAPILAVQGIASGYVSVLVLALYTTTDLVRTAYARQELFWLLCVLLVYWINYMWLMARRGRVPHDPVVFALRDRASLMLISAMAAAALLAVRA